MPLFLKYSKISTLPLVFLPKSLLVSFKAMGVCKDIHYNKYYVSLLNMMKQKISETFIEINFNLNIRDHIQIDDRLFLSQAMCIKI